MHVPSVWEARRPRTERPALDGTSQPGPAPARTSRLWETEAPMDSRWIRRALTLLVLLGGALAFVVALTGSFRDALRTGLVVAGAVAVATIGWTLLSAPQ